MGLLAKLRSSRVVSQPNQVQTQPGSVEKVEYGPGMISHYVGARAGHSIGVSREVLSGPAWGATTPNAFITIQGRPPKTPVVGQVADTRGSNAPEGGGC